MKLTLAQALATVLKIQLIPSTIVGAPSIYVIFGEPTEEPLELGNDKQMDIEGAVRTALEHIGSMSGESAFAIFPIDSEREGFYMEIERELLRQEAMPHMDGHKAWESFGTDPRNAVTAMMDTAREAAINLTVPPVYRKVLLRFACVAVAALQWCDKWIEKLTAIAKDPDLGNRILRPAGFDSTDQIMEQNNICSKHDEQKPCRECATEAAQEENK